MSLVATKGHSNETAGDKPEEGGDDVKSSWPCDDIVIEACEFSETFLKLTPYMSVVLKIGRASCRERV